LFQIACFAYLESDRCWLLTGSSMSIFSKYFYVIGPDLTWPDRDSSANIWGGLSGGANTKYYGIQPDCSLIVTIMPLGQNQPISYKMPPKESCFDFWSVINLCNNVCNNLLLNKPLFPQYKRILWNFFSCLEEICNSEGINICYEKLNKKSRTRHNSIWNLQPMHICMMHSDKFRVNFETFDSRWRKIDIEKWKMSKCRQLGKWKFTFQLNT
jgi:hypothetical protein